MNIDKIVKEYPRAWENALSYIVGSECKHLYLERVLFIDNYIVADTRNQIIDNDFTEYEFHYRELFDYFDSVGVYIGITPVGFGKDTKFATGTKDGDFEFWEDDRTEAEFEAIPKAFEIRNNQIEQNSKEN